MSFPAGIRFDSDLDALLQKLTGANAACLDRGTRGLLWMTGSDRIRFLNGMVSNDVARLAPGQCCPALQLDRRGHVISEIGVIALADGILLEVAPGSEPEVLDLLTRHIVADDVVLESRSKSDGQLAIEGPGGAAAIAAIGGVFPEAGHCLQADWREQPLVFIGGGALTRSGLRVIGLRPVLVELRAALELPELSHEQAEVLRIEGFLPALGIDVDARNFPQEARLERSVSFSKGCYIGQEIVARIASRGSVNRLLVKLASERPVEPGAEILLSGRAIGSVTSAAVSPENGPLALGYVKRAEAAPGTELEIAGARAIVLGPPLEAQRA